MAAHSPECALLEPTLARDPRPRRERIRHIPDALRAPAVKRYQDLETFADFPAAQDARLGIQDCGQTRALVRIGDGDSTTPY